MAAKITLRPVQGQLDQAEFVFEERDTCIIGRSQDCRPRIPDDDSHGTISRHHCLLDINPPDIRVRDFGSLNGTYVNGVKIGQRDDGSSAEEAAGMEFPEHDLKDGDEIQIGETVFRIIIHVPAMCADCSKEIPDDQKAKVEVAPGVYRCFGCQKRAAVLKARNAARDRVRPAVKAKQPVQAGGQRCAACGRDMSKQPGANRRGTEICAKCKADPAAILQHLLRRAKRGQQDVVAIKGYAIERELGRGGMGMVHLARHEQSDELVALKVMLPRVAVNDQAKRMFLREVESTKALKHPHVVELRDSGYSEGTFFFTLEFCDGGSVDKLMAGRGGKLSIDEAGPIILQTLDGLEYAHHVDVKAYFRDGRTERAQGLVHRDMSPQNIFLCGSGTSRIAKVGDFGLGKAFDTAGLSGMSRTGTAFGKPWYMPRQQVVNYKYAKPEVDVWAAAACLYYMLTAAFPREFHPEDKDVWQTVLQTDAVPIRERDSSIPKPLAEVIDLGLIDNPSIHFKSAAALRRALESVL